MKHVTGFYKDIVLLTKIKSRELKKLPLGVLLYLRSTFRNEKLTRIGDKYVINSFIPPFPSPAFEQFAKNAVAVYKRKAFPYSTYIALTNKCSFNCWHCSKCYREGEELSKEMWIQIVEKLQDIGISIIGFTGGEPLLNNDLEDIITAIDTRSTPILFTSGYGLTNERAKSLKSAGLYYIAISLDHYDKKRHNKLRGRADAFDIAMAAINTSLKNNFYTATQLVVRKDMLNAEEMDKYVDFVTKLGVHEIRIIEPMPTGALIKEKDDVFLKKSEREFLKYYHVKINKQKNLTKIASFTYLEDRSMYGCGAGVQHMYVDVFGNICPCDFTPLSFGNIQKEGFDVAYKRLREHFNKPRATCFIQDNIEKIRPFFRKNLPLEHGVSAQICNNCGEEELPKFYKKLGWK